MQQPESRHRGATYPGVGVLAFLALMTLVQMVTWFFRRHGSRETECGVGDCVTTFSGPVPLSAFIIAGVILALLIVAMAIVVRGGRPQEGNGPEGNPTPQEERKPSKA